MLLLLAQGRRQEALAEGAVVTRPMPWSPQVGQAYFAALGFLPIDRAATAALRDRFARWSPPASEVGGTEFSEGSRAL